MEDLIEIKNKLNKPTQRNISSFSTLNNYLSQPPTDLDTVFSITDALEKIMQEPASDGHENLRYDAEMENENMSSIAFIINNITYELRQISSETKAKAEKDADAALNLIISYLEDGSIQVDRDEIIVQRPNGLLLAQIQAYPGDGGMPRYARVEHIANTRKPGVAPSVARPANKPKAKPALSVQRQLAQATKPSLPVPRQKEPCEDYVEALINLVAENECLYNFRLPISMRSRELVGRKWQEICDELSAMFPNMELTKDQIVNKWSHLKDSWNRYHKQKTGGKSGQATKNIRKYVYYDSMAFLLPLQEKKRTMSNIVDSDSDIDSEVEKIIQESKKQKPSKKRRRSLSEGGILGEEFKAITGLAAQVTNALGSNQELPTEHEAGKNFLLSCLPAFLQIPTENLRMKVKMDILNVLQKALSPST